MAPPDRIWLIASAVEGRTLRQIGHFFAFSRLMVMGGYRQK
jgi:hypothetical protein